MADPHPLPSSIDDTLTPQGRRLRRRRPLATVLFLAMKLSVHCSSKARPGSARPIAKVLSAGLGRRLIRLQCYEGLDVASAVYEWNYAA